MGGFRGFAVFSITMVLGAGPGPAGAIARAPDETAHTASPYAYEAARTASPTRLFDRIAQALNREGLTVERRGDGVDIDPKVSIRVLHGIVIALPDNYRVHVTFDGGGRAREGVIGEIASRLVLQREDSRIAQRLNAVRAYSFTVRNADEDAILAPRIALGYDLPSEAMPFARVEIRKLTPKPEARTIETETPVLKPRSTKHTAPAKPEVTEPAPLLDSMTARAPQAPSHAIANAPLLIHTDEVQPPAGITPAIEQDSMPGAKTAPGPFTSGAIDMLESPHLDPESASTALPPEVKSAAPSKPVAPRTAPVIIARVPAEQGAVNAWQLAYRVVRARNAARGRLAARPKAFEYPPQKIESRVLPRTTHGPATARPASPTSLPTKRFMAPAAQDRVAPDARKVAVHAQAGLSFSGLIVLAFFGLTAGAWARWRRRRGAVARCSNALLQSLDALLENADAETSARLRQAMTRAARERMNHSAADALLVIEETRRTAEAIQRRGDSAGAERLLEIIDRERRRLLTNAA